MQSERAALIRQVAEAVLGAMDRHAAAAKQESVRRRDQLAAAVCAGDEAAARKLLQVLYPDEEPDGGVTGRGALCEVAVSDIVVADHVLYIRDLLLLT